MPGVFLVLGVLGGCGGMSRIGGPDPDPEGTAGSGAWTGGTGTGATGGSMVAIGGAAGTGSSAGGTAASGAPSSAGFGGIGARIPIAGCDWPGALTSSCAISSCHGAPRPPLMPHGLLNLTPDDGLVARIKDVPVTLMDVDCDPSVAYVACIPPEPPECQQYENRLLVDSANPAASFIIAKMNGTDCGNVMPMSPGNDLNRGWDEERKQCLEALVYAIAALP